MLTEQEEKPNSESVKAAMDMAWRDHHHARDQTWRVLQIEAILGAGLVTVDAQFQSLWATMSAGVLVILAAFSGMLISWHHRKLERRKFIHIMNCEEWLGLRRDDLIPLAADDLQQDTRPCRVKDGTVTVPRRMRPWDIVNPRVQNTAVFIMRMHFAIASFGALMVIIRCCKISG